MKLSLGILILLVTNIALADQFIQYPYFGEGSCNIRSLPCADGQPIDCSANSIYGGNCMFEEQGNLWTVSCYAVGNVYKSFTKSCIKPKSE